MSSLRRPSLAGELTAVSPCGGDLSALAAAVWTAVGRFIPFDFACLATVDPSTGLVSWAHKSRPLEIGDEAWAAMEYGERDVNQFADLAARAEPVGVLSIDTGGNFLSCRRFRDLLAPQFGFTDELRVSLRTHGLVWGAVALYRATGEPPFTPQDARAMLDVHTQIAELVRQAVFSTDPRIGPEVGAGSGPRRSDPANGPAVIVVDHADRVLNITAAAHARIEDLGGWDVGSPPISVLTAIAAARNTPELAVARTLGRSGTWLIVRATTFTSGTGAGAGAGSAPADDVVVTIDAATPADITAMTLAARGLSSREQDVAGLVLQGAATRAIAAGLHLSPHTVQDHLKSIFAKLGVNSRREMVSQLVLN